MYMYRHKNEESHNKVYIAILIDFILLNEKKIINICGNLWGYMIL